MNEPDFEQQLQAARLAAPSDQLDRRLDEVFRESAGAAHGERRPFLWWWLVPTATGVFGLWFSLYSPPVHPTTPVVYQFEPQGLMREWLLTPPAGSQTPPAMVVSVTP